MIKTTSKRVIAALLRAEARAVLKKYKPKIVGITGSVGKTTTKDAIAAVLSTRFVTRASQKSFNSEIGLPLAILGCPNAWSNPLGWVKNLISGLSLIVFRASYPEWLVLEVGADRPGDISGLASWLALDVVVLTRLPEVPVHVEFFDSPGDVVNEKMSLVRALKSDGVVVVNGDDPAIVRALTAFKQQPITCTFGLSDGATVRASGVEALYGDRRPVGLACQIESAGEVLPLRLRGTVGQAHIMAALAAVVVAQGEDIGLPAAIGALERQVWPPGRMRIIPGIKDTIIVDDSYNSSPVALEAALRTMQELVAYGRKIVVLGDMMELGPYTIEAHRHAGSHAAKVCHFLITVGIRAKFISDEAERRRLSRKKIMHFNTAIEAGKWLQDFVAPDDLILVKGSQSMRMERVVEEIMLHPEDKKTLLVRQDAEWQKR